MKRFYSILLSVFFFASMISAQELVEKEEASKPLSKPRLRRKLKRTVSSQVSVGAWAEKLSANTSGAA